MENLRALISFFSKFQDSPDYIPWKLIGMMMGTTGFRGNDLPSIKRRSIHPTHNGGVIEPHASCGLSRAPSLTNQTNRLHADARPFQTACVCHIHSLAREGGAKLLNHYAYLTYLFISFIIQLAKIKMVFN